MYESGLLVSLLDGSFVGRAFDLEDVVIVSVDLLIHNLNNNMQQPDQIEKRASALEESLKVVESSRDMEMFALEMRTRKVVHEILSPILDKMNVER